MSNLNSLTVGKKLLWVAGGRDFNDMEWMSAELGGYGRHTVLITGAAPGADSQAERVFQLLDRPYVGIPADWNRLGKPAGAIRNRVIGGTWPEELLVFPGGKGTWDAVEVAHSYDIPVRYA
jgi:hypothetical protein